MKKNEVVKYYFHSILKALAFALLLTLLLGYLFGYKAILVNGWSAQPDIKYQSLIITTKVKAEDLKVGDYITFTMTGQSYITHQIISIDLENDVIVCADNQYNQETGEYEHGGTQTFGYKNVVGKVIFSSYLLGKTAFTIRENPWILFGLLGSVVLLFIVKEQTSIEPEF